SSLADVLQLEGASMLAPEHVRTALTSETTGPKVRRQIEATLLNPSLREQLTGHLVGQVAAGNEILGRWAVALTASATYAEIFDQHVELYLRANGLQQFL